MSELTRIWNGSRPRFNADSSRGHHAGTLLVAGVLLVLLEATAAATPIAADEVRKACNRISLCPAQLPDLAAFCVLSQTAAPKNADWAQVKVPKAADLIAATCPAIPSPALAGGIPGFNPTAISALGINQSALVWGATDFLISRAEKELRAWSVDRFLDEVCGEDSKAKIGDELVFKKSCEIATGIQLKGFLGGMTTYQAAMRQDLAHVPFLLFKHLAAASPANQQDAFSVFALLSEAIESELNGAGAIAAIQSIANNASVVPISCGATPAAAVTFEAAALLASLPVSGATSGEVQLPKDPPSWVLALMALAINSTDPGSGISKGWPSACPPTGQIPFDVEKTYTLATALKVLVEDLASAAAQLKNAPAGVDPSYRLELYAAVLRSTVHGFVTVLNTYGGGKLLSPEVKEALAVCERVAADLAQANYAGAVITMSTAVTAAGLKAAMPSEFPRIASFGVDIAQATTADAAAAAFERFAAPVGSYKRKRTGGGYISVNGYLGFGATAELAQQAPNTWNDAKWGFAPGFWAPIGLELGVGSKNGYGSIGLLLQAVDLGVLSSWRIRGDNDAVAGAPDVGVRQVFSPGAFVIYGIPNAPLSIGVGVAFAPSLRDLTMMTSEEVNVFRVGANLAVDIPIFP
jgi:hypothetical protein